MQAAEKARVRWQLLATKLIKFSLIVFGSTKTIFPSVADGKNLRRSSRDQTSILVMSRRLNYVSACEITAPKRGQFHNIRFNWFCETDKVACAFRGA